jgi:hypothetical protein
MIPRDVVWLVRRLVPTAALSDAVLGDLEEDAARVCASSSEATARWWCRTQLAQSLFSLAALGAPRRLRLLPTLVVAAVMGYASIVLVVLASTSSMAAIGITESSMAGTTGRIVTNLVAAVAGGFFASRIARRAPILGAMGLGALLWLMGLWWLLTEAQSPRMSQLVFIVGAPLVVMAGALLRRPRT